MLLLLQILVYIFALWLGCYLLVRSPRKPGVRAASLGLLSYAAAVALDTLLQSTDAVPQLEQIRILALFLPSAFWFSAATHLLPDPSGAARYVPLVALALVAVFLLAAGDTAFLLVAGVIAGMMLVALGLIVRALRARLPRRPLVILLTATLFFLLGLGLFVLPLKLISGSLALLAIGFDLALLGCAIALLDAYDEGESLWLDGLRSLVVAGLSALVFGGQVALVITAQTAQPLLLLLLYGILTAAVVIPTAADPLGALVDRLVFARFDRLRRARADLRATASALPRTDEALNLAELDEEDFARLTRRALSHMSHPGRLAASPLARLPLIDRRLNARGEAGNTLERAAELRALLTESILRLKPRGPETFGTTDDWRYYNVLYFPYVLGIKPNSRNGQAGELDPSAEAVLEWFLVQVPERTLHNWQNAAARLVARDLRERAFD